jgi:hypothetical protein
VLRASFLLFTIIFDFATIYIFAQHFYCESADNKLGKVVTIVLYVGGAVDVFY